MFPLVVALVLHQKFPIGKMLRFSIALLSHLLRGGFLLFCKLHRYVLSVLISYAKDLVCSEYYLYIKLQDVLDFYLHHHMQRLSPYWLR